MPTPSADRISSSTLSPLAQCGLAGYLRRVGLRETSRPPGLNFGAGFHTLLELHHRKRLGRAQGIPPPYVCGGTDGSPAFSEPEEVFQHYAALGVGASVLDELRTVYDRYIVWEAGQPPWTILGVEVDCTDPDTGYSAQIDLIIDGTPYGYPRCALAVEVKTAGGYYSEATTTRYAHSSQVIGYHIAWAGSPIDRPLAGTILNIVNRKVAKKQPPVHRTLVVPPARRVSQLRAALRGVVARRSSPDVPRAEGILTGACYGYYPCRYLDVCETGFVGAGWHVEDPEALRAVGLVVITDPPPRPVIKTCR